MVIFKSQDISAYLFLPKPLNDTVLYILFIPPNMNVIDNYPAIKIYDLNIVRIQNVRLAVAVREFISRAMLFRNIDNIQKF